MSAVSGTSSSARSRIAVNSPEAYLNRELSWLGFASRVVALVENRELPLLERVKFAGIAGMLHDEFFMKRISGLKRQIRNRSKKTTIDGRSPETVFRACQVELRNQSRRLGETLLGDLGPAMSAEGVGIVDFDRLQKSQRQHLREYFQDTVMPILTPLAVDPEHPFPFISNLGLNLAILFTDDDGRERFVRIKVPDNRPRWVPLPDGSGFTPLEQVIAGNIDLLYPEIPPLGIYAFRVTRGSSGDPDRFRDLLEDESQAPGSIIQQVSGELKARRFAGAVRLQVNPDMPAKLAKWLIRQLELESADLYPTRQLLGLSDLAEFNPGSCENLRFAPHRPMTHPRLRRLEYGRPAAIFNEIGRGDILLHHPYHSFDSSVLKFIEAAAVDPDVLAIKLTIYRTSGDSPIVKALAEAARRGKQVAVLVEVTARFDEAPNIAWGKYLENEGVHVAYGVERLKTHVKLALVLREEEQGRIRHYAHVGTGNYHTGTAKVYEDVGILTSDPEVCRDIAAVFNALTGKTPHTGYSQMIVAPVAMRKRFNQLIRREAKHASAGRPCGIHAKMNQLQDAGIIRELYKAGQAGVPVTLNIRGLCCLRPGVPGLSENIRVFSVLGRFLEHSRIYRFVNGGDPEYFLGSADWMKRNLKKRVETVVPVRNPDLKQELEEILGVYESDNASAWDCRPDGTYVGRSPEPGQPARAAQEVFIERAGTKSQPGNRKPGRRSSRMTLRRI